MGPSVSSKPAYLPLANLPTTGGPGGGLSTQSVGLEQKSRLFHLYHGNHAREKRACLFKKLKNDVDAEIGRMIL